MNDPLDDIIDSAMQTARGGAATRDPLDDIIDSAIATARPGPAAAPFWTGANRSAVPGASYNQPVMGPPAPVQAPLTPGNFDQYPGYQPMPLPPDARPPSSGDILGGDIERASGSALRIAGGLAQYIPDFIQNPAMPGVTPDMIGRGLASFGGQMQRDSQPQPSMPTNFQRALGGGPSLGMSVAPVVAAGAIGGPLAGAAVGGLMQAGGTTADVRETLEAKGDPNARIKAIGAGAASGAGGAMLNYLPIARALGPAAGAIMPGIQARIANIAARYGPAAAENALSGLGESVMDQLARMAAGTQDQFDDGVAFDSAMIEGVIGVGLRGVADLGSKLSPQGVPNAQVPQADPNRMPLGPSRLAAGEGERAGGNPQPVAEAVAGSVEGAQRPADSAGAAPVMGPEYLRGGDPRPDQAPGAAEGVAKPTFSLLNLGKSTESARAKGGISSLVKKKGLDPAFRDGETGKVYPSMYPAGYANKGDPARPAPVHIMDGLPAEVVVRSESAKDAKPWEPPQVLEVKGSVEPGFVDADGKFYTRQEAADLNAPTPPPDITTAIIEKGRADAAAGKPPASLAGVSREQRQAYREGYRSSNRAGPTPEKPSVQTKTPGKTTPISDGRGSSPDLQPKPPSPESVRTEPQTPNPPESAQTPQSLRISQSDSASPKSTTPPEGFEFSERFNAVDNEIERRKSAPAPATSTATTPREIAEDIRQRYQWSTTDDVNNTLNDHVANNRLTREQAAKIADAARFGRWVNPFDAPAPVESTTGGGRGAAKPDKVGRGRTKADKSAKPLDPTPPPAAESAAGKASEPAAKVMEPEPGSPADMANKRLEVPADILKSAKHSAFSLEKPIYIVIPRSQDSSHGYPRAAGNMEVRESASGNVAVLAVVDADGNVQWKAGRAKPAEQAPTPPPDAPQAGKGDDAPAKRVPLADLKIEDSAGGMTKERSLQIARIEKEANEAANRRGVLDQQMQARKKEIGATPEAAAAIEAAVKAVPKGKGVVKGKAEAQDRAFQEFLRKDKRYQELEREYHSLSPREIRAKAESVKADAAKDSDNARLEAIAAYEKSAGEYSWMEIQDALKTMDRGGTDFSARTGRIVQRAGDPRVSILEKIHEEKMRQFDSVSRPDVSGEVLPQGFEYGKGAPTVGEKAAGKDQTQKVSVDDPAKYTKRAEIPAEHEAVKLDAESPSEKKKSGGIAKLKEFARAVPEFKLDPTFVVGKDGSLSFQDGKRFKFISPEVLGLRVGEPIKEGQRIRVDLDALKAAKGGQMMVIEPSPDGAPVNTPPPIGSKLLAAADKAEKAARERIAKRPGIPRGRNTGGGIIGQELADRAMIVAAKVIKAGVRTAQAIEKAFTEMQAELGTKFDNNSARKIKYEAQKILNRTTMQDGEETVAQMVARLTGEVKKPEVPAPKPAAKEPERTNTVEHDPDQTSARMGWINADRRDILGLPETENPGTRSWETVLERAADEVKADPDMPMRLVKELEAKPRVVSDTETAAMTIKAVELKEQHKNLMKQGEGVTDDAKIADLAIKTADVESQLTQLSEVLRTSGTEVARALAARKLTLDNDLSLVTVRVRATIAKGSKLTADETAYFDKLTKDLADVEQEIEANKERYVNATLDAMIEDMKRQVAPPKITTPAAKPKLVDKFVLSLNEAADAARARIKARTTKLYSGIAPDPAAFADEIIIGASHIANGIVKGSAWAGKMVSEFGAGIKPYLRTIYGESYKKVTGQDAPADAIPGAKTTKEKMAARVEDGADVTELGAYINEMALELVRSGVTKRDALLDALHKEVKEAFPKITKNQVRDILSGYGKFVPLDKEAAKVRLREIKSESQKLAQLEALVAKKAPLATGFERQAPSAEARALTKQVNEAKKKAGILPGGAGRLKTLLETTKNRLRNQISDMQSEIDTGKRIVRGKPVPLSDPELAKLRQTVADLRKLHDAAFKTDEQKRVKAAEGAAKRSAEEWERRLQEAKNGRFENNPKNPPVSTAEITALKARAEAARSRVAELKDADPAQQAKEEADWIQGYRTRLAEQTADLHQQLAANEFRPPAARRGMPKTAEIERLAYLRDRARSKVRRAIENLKPKSSLHKGMQATKEVVGFSRQVLTSLFDVSAIGRQGIVAAAGHPRMAGKAIATMTRGMLSRVKAHANYEKAMNSENAPLYKRAKLYLAPMDHSTLTSKEEGYQTNITESISELGKERGGWVSKIAAPVRAVGHVMTASERAYNGFLNSLRVQMFDQLVHVNGKSQESIEAAANYINLATGRGKLYGFERSGDTLAKVLFSPRLMMSRMELLAGEPIAFAKGKDAKFMVMREYARTMIGFSVMAGLAVLAGGEFVEDPRKTDFGMMKFGDMRTDFFGGLPKYIRGMARLITRVKINADGKEKDLTGYDTAHEFYGMFRSKASPIAGSLLDLLYTGEDYADFGDKEERVATVKEELQQLFTPMTFSDAKNLFEKEGLDTATAGTIFNLLGFSSKSYAD